MDSKDKKDDIKPVVSTSAEKSLQNYAGLHWKLIEKKNQDKSLDKVLSTTKFDLKHAQEDLKNTISDFITIFYEAIYTSRYEFDLKISKQRQLCEDELRKYKQMKLKRQKEDERMEGRVVGPDEKEQQEEDMQALSEQRTYIKECLSTLTMLKQQCNSFLEYFYHEKCLFSWENGDRHHGASNIVKSLSQRFSLLKLKWTLIKIESDLVADHFWPSGEVAFVKVFYHLQIENDEPIEVLDIFQVKRKDFEVQYKMKRKKSIQVSNSRPTTSGSTTEGKDNKENQSRPVSAEEQKDNKDSEADDKSKVDSKSDVKAEEKEEKNSSEPLWEEISIPFDISTLIITRQAFSIIDVRPLYGWPEVVMDVVADIDEIIYFAQEEAEEEARRKEEEDDDDDEADEKEEEEEEIEEPVKEEEKEKEVSNEDKPNDTQEVRIEGGSGEVATATAIDTNTTPVVAEQQSGVQEEGNEDLAI